MYKCVLFTEGANYTSFTRTDFLVNTIMIMAYPIFITNPFTFFNQSDL